MRLAVSLALFLAVATLGAGAADPPGADVVLARARAALGGDAILQVKAMHVKGNITVVGINGTQEQWQDVAGGRYAEYQQAGPVSGGDGFDGRDYWVRDASGIVHVEGSTAGRLQGVNAAFLNGFGLFEPGRGGATVASLPQQTAAGATYDVLRVTPRGGSALDMWFDARTGLPYRVVVPLGTQTFTSTLDDYRRTGAVLFPYHQHGESDTGNSEDTHVTSVDVNPPAVEERVRRPVSDVHDYSIDGGATSTSIPIELVDNHAYLDVRLNGKGPFRFIFDSGGANFVDPSVLAQLGASGQGNAQGTGVGAQTESSSFARIATLQVGRAKLTNQAFLVAPVRAGFGVGGGAPVDGLIGYEVLARYVTTYDYEHRRVILRLPNSMPAGGLGAPLTFVFQDNTPQFRGSIDGTAADMTVDTGSRVAISIFKPFADAHPNVVPAKLTAPGANGFGVGGAEIGRLGRVASLRIGPYDIRNVIGDYSEQTKGAFANPFVAANVGGAVWKRFSVTFDYPNYRMYLAPNASFARPENFDRSGMFLINRSGAVTVFDVRPGTPAAAEGIQKGDVISAVDGRPAAGTPLAAVRNALMRPGGTRVRLVMARGGQPRTVDLVLRDYV